MKKVGLLERFSLWRSWRKRCRGEEVVDWIRGVGYYLPRQFGGYRKDIGMIRDMPTDKGRTCTYKLLRVDTFSNPPDMIERSYWQLIGEAGKKPLSEMSFKEYLQFGGVE